MSDLTEGQRQALWDCYTTLRSIRETFTDKIYFEIRTLCETSEYLLVAEFDEVKELEATLNSPAKEKR
jgi:hypothetical protein